MKLTAKMPILYRAHLYDVGDELPAMDQIMVQAWLEAGSAEWKEDTQEAERPAKKPKAKKATAQPGQIGMSTTGNQEDLAGRIPDTQERKTR